MSERIIFQSHSGFPGKDPDGEQLPFGYLAKPNPTVPVFELRTFLEYPRKELDGFIEMIVHRVNTHDALVDALRLIRGWREIDRNTLRERLTAIEEIADKALALAEGGENG